MKIQRYYKYLLSAGAIALLALSCSDDPNNKPVPSVPTSDRTVLVYMEANNNLGSSGFDADDIEEMKIAADNGDIPAGGRLLVYHHAYAEDPVLLEIKNKSVDTLAIYDTSTYSIHSERMTKVLDDVVKLGNAREYGIVFWSHGSGWLQDGISDPIDELATYSYGYDRSRSMNITTLARVLETIPNLDFIYFDCCYMASVETIYELRHCANTIVASATELVNTGMPYQDNVACLFSKGKADLENAARNTFRYYDSKTGLGRTCTMSVVQTSGLEALAHATSEIYKHSSTGIPSGYIPQRFSNISINNCYYFDFKDYVKALSFNGDNERFDGASDLFCNFEKIFDNVVTYSAATPFLWNSVALDRHNGLSSYILKSDDAISVKNYNTLSWYRDVASNLVRK